MLAPVPPELSFKGAHNQHEMPSHQVLLSTRFVYVAAAASNEVRPALRRRVSVIIPACTNATGPKDVATG